jgi:hypothetical protein
MTKDPNIYQGQWLFQRRYVVGRILNVGCNNDGAKLREHFGAVNVDLSLKDDASGDLIPADVLADARSLPFRPASFNTIVLGELLEHFTDADAVRTIEGARALMNTSPVPGGTAVGRVIITIPHDDRKPHEQGYGALWEKPYAEGVPRYHPREITRFDLFGWIQKAGLTVALWADIMYIWGKTGTGVVAV